MRKVRLPPGPAVVDLLGTALTDDDVRRLSAPAAGGVILFARNFESIAQVEVLIDEVKRIREPELPVCVDHEGGRVQRFR